MKLYELPEILTIELCSEWLFLEELTKLDTAIGTKKLLRDWLLKQFNRFNYRHVRDDDVRLGCMKWVMRRKMKLSSVILSSSMGKKDLTKFQKMCKVLSLRLNPTSEMVCWFVEGAATNLTSIDLTRSNTCIANDDVLFKIGDCCSALQQLCLNYLLHISDTGVCYVVENCSLLNSLSMNETKIGNKTITAISKQCKNLNRLSVRRCFNITSVGVFELSACVSNCVQTMELDGFQVLSEDNNSMSRLLQHTGATLTKLSLCRVRAVSLLLTISTYCLSLLSIELSGCHESSDAFSAMLMHCKQLQHLTMLMSPMNSSDTAHAIAEHMSCFKSIKCWFSSNPEEENQQFVRKLTDMLPFSCIDTVQIDTLQNQIYIAGTRQNVTFYFFSY